MYQSPEELEIEKRCLENSGIPYEQFEIDNVIIDEEGNYVRTFQIGMNQNNSKPPKEKMVIIHGYGGTAIMFWPVMKDLAEDYHLILVDQLGKGSSSRPEFTYENANDATDFLVGWVEKWRQTIGILNEKFILCGHSLGAYVSGHYTKRYPQYVKKLLLLSPFGVPKRTFTDEEFPEVFNSYTPPPGQFRPPLFMFKVTKKLWEKKWSPYAGMRKCCDCFLRFQLNGYIRRKFKEIIPWEHRLNYKEYLLQNIKKPGSTEYVIFVCFDHYLHAVLPLDDENCLRGLDIPISIVYGDIDWMSGVGTHDLLSSNPYKGTFSHQYVLEGSDHNLFFDNPTGLVKIIKDDLRNLHEFVPKMSIDPSDDLKLVHLIVEENEHRDIESQIDLMI